MPCVFNNLNPAVSRRDLLKTVGVGLASAALFSHSNPALSLILESGELESRFADLIKRAGENDIAKWAAFSLTPTSMPWDGSLMPVEEGEQITFILTGRWYMSRPADLWFEPGFAFHAKIADGALYNPSLNAGTVKADKSGPLMIARSTSQFKNAQGELAVPKDIYQDADGQIDGIAIRWKADAQTGLKNILDSAGDINGLLAMAHQRLATPKPTPEGWYNHFNFGGGETFTRGGNNEVCCDTHKNVAILQHDVDHMLEPGLMLNWQWNVEELPSKVAENTIPTHDYLSIAVEFDDGQDLTYLWSAEMPVGEVFRCPLPGWDKIETHCVQRSGLQDMGKWLNEERDVSADYKEYIGGPATRVVRVWLLGVSAFQRKSGYCRFADIKMSNGTDIEHIV